MAITIRKIPCPDTTLQVNGVTEGTFAAGSTIDVNLTDGTNPVTPDSVTVVGDVVTVQVPEGVPQSGIEYFEPNKILFDNISYAMYDAKWRIDNGLYANTPPANPIYKQELDFSSADPFNTLLHDNIFDNKLRFTDNIGGEITAINPDDSEIYDHLTGRIYVFISSGTIYRNWADALAYAQSLGLYIPSREEYMSLKDMRVTGVIRINNINADLLGGSRHPWTCNVDQSNTLNAIRIDNNNFPTLSLARTSTSRSTLCVKLI